MNLDAPAIFQAPIERWDEENVAIFNLITINKKDPVIPDIYNQRAQRKENRYLLKYWSCTLVAISSIALLVLFPQGHFVVNATLYIIAGVATLCAIINASLLRDKITPLAKYEISIVQLSFTFWFSKWQNSDSFLPNFAMYTQGIVDKQQLLVLLSGAKLQMQRDPKFDQAIVLIPMIAELEAKLK